MNLAVLIRNCRKYPFSVGLKFEFRIISQKAFIGEDLEKSNDQEKDRARKGSIDIFFFSRNESNFLS
jgi:hypothetical protein